MEAKVITFGEIAYVAWMKAGGSEYVTYSNCKFPEDWEKAAKAVIEEYERRKSEGQ